MVTYVEDASVPVRNTGAIRLYGEDGFEGMRAAGALAARALDAVEDMVTPGTTTAEIDRFVFEFGRDHGAVPATLGYRGYMRSCCTSINHVVCHGIPNDKPLREGEIVNIDITYILDGWHGDSSRMYGVGRLKRASERLIEVT
ncbi:MAG: M24 family metallopeptidase, partial [Hyphomicrobiaceae bacterium]|nr:M24 family metallopeptidase [Hyphomicrobiaceae bacterium]